MSIGSWLFGSSVEAVAKPVEAVGTALDKLFTSDDERAAAAIVMEKLRQQPDILQAEITKIEAAHPSVFVAGSRPFIMWICGFSLLYASIIEPIARFICAVFFGYSGIFPVIDTDITLQILFGILGLGAFRSFEKVKKVAHK